MATEHSPPVYDSEKLQAPPTTIHTEDELAVGENGKLKRGLHGRHMQMIAIGGVIGAGLFVGAGSALSKGGPASVVSKRILTLRRRRLTDECRSYVL